MNCVIEGGQLTGTTKTGITLKYATIYHEFNETEYYDLHSLCCKCFPEWINNLGVTHKIEYCTFVQVPILIKENE